MPPLRALEVAASEILGRPLAADEAAKFAKYLKLLADWNAVHRLVGSADPEWIVQNLFIDSLLFLRVLPSTFATLLDIGSGAGFPGVPIKIVTPSTQLTMIESRQRRGSFLSALVRELPLDKTAVITSRAEAVVNDLRGAFDAVVMKCTGPPSEMLPLAAQFAKSGGVVAVSGPPVPSSLPVGDWVTVQRKSGEYRLFAVYRVPGR